MRNVKSIKGFKAHIFTYFCHFLTVKEAAEGSNAITFHRVRISKTLRKFLWTHVVGIVKLKGKILVKASKHR